TLLIFLCWSLACGEYRLLPLTVLVASFVVQCQLAFVPPSLGLLAVGLVGLGLSLRSSRGEAEGQRRAEAGRQPRAARRGVWRWALAALLVAAVCWTPPLIDQIQGNPGNLTAVLRTAKANPPTLGAGVGWHAVVRAIGVPPWWLRDPASPWERKHEVRASSGAFATISTIVILLGLLALAVAGVLRRQAELWAGALIALALCAGLAAVAASTPTMRVLAETLGYTMWWGSPAGMFVWVMVGWGTLATLAEAGLPRLRAPELASVAGVVALAGVATVVAVSERPDYHRPEYRPLSAVYAGLEQGIPTQRTVLLIGSLGNDTFRFKMAARFALVRRGIRPLSPGKDVRLGSWYEQDHRRYDCVVYVKDGTARPAGPSSAARRSSRARPAGSARPTSPGGPARLLASVKFDEGGGERPVTVWSAPAGCPRQATGAPVAG
ncbi:MAG: hypothetical protein JWO23_1196, partial [Solirubrobacterales bacterium]|nr:hypothetical protein [Solirubrobacterales bacterium]